MIRNIILAALTGVILGNICLTYWLMKSQTVNMKMIALLQDEIEVLQRRDR